MLKMLTHLAATAFAIAVSAGGALAQSQQLFGDKSSVTSGPGAVVRVGNFVGAPQGGATAGNTVINVTSGTFRFVSGTRKPESYTIKTPLATLGVRGTVIEGSVTPELEIFVLIEGSFRICTSKECRIVTKLGSYTAVRPDGTITTPIECDATLLELNATPDYARQCEARHTNKGTTTPGAFAAGAARQFCTTFADNTLRQCFFLPEGFFGGL